MSSPLKADNPLLDRGYLSAVLAENGLRLSRDRGQNFITDGGVLERILEEAGLADSETVLEIGPGLGTMTVEMRKICPVVAVECDRGIARLLGVFCPEGTGFTLIREDFLKVDP
ncbi:MAG TPA: rRNA adenine N-6-methyltransferase family protein, partial [bacterium]|nr:rRNA adenine N-6-methyltransferase family protein [bacterium]